MQSPLVSVLTPSLNQARWLPDNLLSVRAQTYPRIEHIVMDGQSTDGSVEVLKAHGGPHLRWRSEPDSGQSDAINKAFEESRGEIVGWLNSDDAYFSQDAISLVVDAFDRHPEADVVFGHAALVDGDGLILHVMWTPASAFRLMRFHNYLSQPAVFLRRRALALPMVDPAFDFMMDWELWLRLTRRNRFVRVNRILAIDRHQPNRKIITRQDLAVADQARLRDMYRLASGPLARFARKLLTIAFRLVGVTRLPEVVSARLAFHGHLDGNVSLLLRQIAIPRERMGFGRETHH